MRRQGDSGCNPRLLTIGSIHHRRDVLRESAPSSQPKVNLGPAIIISCRETLESGGLARRERSKRDRRAVEIALSAEGRRRLQGGKRVLVDLLNELVAPYTHRELETLIGLIQRMLLRLQQSEPHEEARVRPEPRRRAGRRSILRHPT